MALKKMRSKSHKGTVKRIKVSNGGDLKEGKLMANRPNDNHRLIKKSRERKLRARRETALSATHTKLKAIMK